MVDTIGNSCYICGRTFKSDKSFSVHILEAHGNENHKCDQCDKEFESKEQLEIHMMVTHPEGQDSLDDEDREGTEPLKLRFMKGYDHTDPRNPGVLVVNEAYRFAFNKSRGDQLHYHCLKKGSTKSKCTVVSQLESVNGTDVFKYEVDQKKDIDDHNHDSNEADVIIAEMLQEMHSKFRKNLTVKPSVVRKQVMQKYRAKYSGSDNWRKVIDSLPDNPSIDRGIARVREKVWGKMPTNRDDLEYKKVLETVEGGNVVEVMDSDEFWENKEFREELKKVGVLDQDFLELEEDEVVPENPLKRVIIFSSQQQLEIFENCEKG